jgi:hypothetical protein
VSKNAHSPTPWFVTLTNGFCFIRSSETTVAKTTSWLDAEFIRLACSNHDSLLAACKAVLKALDYRDCSPDPTKPNYANPAVVAADRSIAERMVREAVARVETEED